ncbi:MAG TPA: protein translocase subunit SecF [Candidatus Limadaptatus stercorigallinarum]|uniref:Protein translocase subunit SecF n=1 Tax=Candidatus Limadaptatus stercorigallinarum TaxID=2840845 RepID=A0A9D1L249_9FIRM|nr:protein translocase subunit SecF [Candidatus Limadaptatus stercorigallinarum]
MKNSGATFLDRYSRFSVSKLKKFTFVIPLVFVLIALAVIIGIGETTGDYSNGVNVGIDFEGGTMLTVNLDDDMLADMTYDEHVDMITETIESVEDANGSRVSVSYIQQLSGDGGISVTFRYKNVSSDDSEINALNEAIIAAVDALYPEKPNSELNFITYESIGATAAQDLLSKAGIALAVSTVLILIYIVIRFTPTAAFAAVLALIHDVILMFALTVICRVQINSSYVAAMITIIAYSINNTIIIFDRCREYMKPLKGMKNIDYDAIGDTSVRENMRRSVFTTATTMVTVIFLAILGSASIREFCVPIILGLLAGLYSSVFLATPMWAAFTRSWDKMKAKRAATAVYGGGASSVKDDEDTEQVFPVEKRDDEDDDDGFTPRKTEKSGKQGGNKPKGKTIYKYSKKNTTFKKKK